jgi:hypothetical protein
MTKIVLLLMSAATLCAQFVPFTPDDSTRLSYTVRAFTRAGERKIQRRDFYLDTFGKTGQPIKRRMVVTFDPVTGYYLFGYDGRGEFDGALEQDKSLIQSDAERTTVRYAAYISERRMFLAWAGRSALGISEATQKATSLDDAEQRAIRTLSENAVEAAGLGIWSRGARWIVLVNHENRALIPLSFDVPFTHPWGEPVTVVGIAESPEGWVITLECEYKVRVTLSPSFGPLKAEPVDPKSPWDPPSLHHDYENH